jgi:hypothetical protein
MAAGGDLSKRLRMTTVLRRVAMQDGIKRDGIITRDGME